MVEEVDQSVQVVGCGGVEEDVGNVGMHDLVYLLGVRGPLADHFVYFEKGGSTGRRGECFCENLAHSKSQD